MSRNCPQPCPSKGRARRSNSACRRPRPGASGRACRAAPRSASDRSAVRRSSASAAPAAWRPARGFGGGFFSSFLIASAIGSGLTGSGFFSAGFGSSFRLVLDGLRRVGFLLDRLFLDLRLRRRRGLGHDRRLLGDLADGIVDGLGFGDFLGQRLRVFLLAGLHAGHDLGKLVGRNDIDRDRILPAAFRAPWSRTTASPTPARGRAGQPTPDRLVDLDLHLSFPAPLSAVARRFMPHEPCSGMMTILALNPAVRIYPKSFIISV